MTRHLTPEELVNGLDCALTPGALKHLDRCESCRTALADLDAALGEVRATADVPEPSPLFWDHLVARVRAETDSAPVPSHARWWWQPLTALGAAAALGLFMLLSRPPAPAIQNRELAAVTDADADAPWKAMAQIASTLSADDVKFVVASAPEAALAVNDLTPREREAFVRLLNVEMGGLE